MDASQQQHPSTLYAILDELGLGFIFHINEQEPDFELSRGSNETKWIALSSCFFGVPGIWYLTEYLQEDASQHQLQPINIFSAMLILTSLISANYWRDAKRGWRRNADLIMAKITFSTGLYYSVQYIINPPIFIAIFSSCPFLLYFYIQSSRLISQNNRDWVKYHFAFHILLAVGGALVLRGIETNINKCIEQI